MAYQEYSGEVLPFEEYTGKVMPFEEYTGEVLPLDKAPERFTYGYPGGRGASEEMMAPERTAGAGRGFVNPTPEEEPQQEVITSARAWRGAGAGQGSALTADPRRLDVPQAGGGAGDFLAKSAHSGLLSLNAGLAKLASTAVVDEADLAALYKTDPAGLQKQLDDGAATFLLRFARSQQQGSEAVMADLSPEAKSGYGDLKYATLDEGKSAWRSPIKILGDAIQSLPSTLAMGLSIYATKGASKTATAEALAAGLPAEAAQAAGILAAERMMVRAGASSEGAIGYAQQANQTREAADRIQDSDLAQSKPYQDLLSQGYDPQTARVLVSANATEQAGVIAGIVDGATNAVGGKFLGRIIGEGGKPTVAGFKAAVTEAITEGIQSPGEQYGQNLATQKNLNPNQDLSEGVVESALQGVGVGGFTGGVFGAASTRGSSRPSPEVIADKVMATGSLDEALVVAEQGAGTSTTLEPNGRTIDIPGLDTGTTGGGVVDAGTGVDAGVVVPNPVSGTASAMAAQEGVAVPPPAGNTGASLPGAVDDSTLLQNIRARQGTPATLESSDATQAQNTVLARVQESSGTSQDIPTTTNGVGGRSGVLPNTATGSEEQHQTTGDNLSATQGSGVANNGTPRTDTAAIPATELAASDTLGLDTQTGEGRTGVPGSSLREPLLADAGATEHTAPDLAEATETVRLLSEADNRPSMVLADYSTPEVQAAHTLTTALAELTGTKPGVIYSDTAQGARDGLQFRDSFGLNIDRPEQHIAVTAAHEFGHLADQWAESDPTVAKHYDRIWNLTSESGKKTYFEGVLFKKDGTLYENATADQLGTLKREMRQDFMGQRFNDKPWLMELSQKSPAKFGKFINTWIGALNHIEQKLRGLLGVNREVRNVDLYIEKLGEAKATAMEVAQAWAERNPRLAAQVGEVNLAIRQGPKEAHNQNDYLVPETGDFKDGNLTHLPPIRFKSGDRDLSYEAMPVRVQLGQHLRNGIPTGTDQKNIAQYGLQHRLDNAAADPSFRGLRTPELGTGAAIPERAIRDVAAAVLTAKTVYADKKNADSVVLYNKDTKLSVVLEKRKDAEGTSFWSVKTVIPKREEVMWASYGSPTAIDGINFNGLGTQQTKSFLAGTLDKLQAPSNFPSSRSSYSVDATGKIVNPAPAAPQIAAKKQRDANGRLIKPQLSGREDINSINDLGHFDVDRFNDQYNDQDHELDAQYQAAKQAELEHELKASGIRAATPSAGEHDFNSIKNADLKAAGFMAESAYPKLDYKTAMSGARIASFKIGDTSYRAILSELGPNVERDAIRANKPGAKGLPLASELSALSPQAREAWNQRYAAAGDLYRRGFDLAKTVTPEAQKNILATWKGVAKNPDAFEFAKAEPVKASSIQGVAQGIADQMLKGSRYQIKVLPPKMATAANDFDLQITDTKSRTTGEAHVEFDLKSKQMVMHTDELDKGTGLGKPAYQVGQAFAKQVGARIEADGLLMGVNNYRRTEQAFSGALRSGDFNTMQPGAGQRIYGWNEKAETEAQKDQNFVRMAVAQARNVLEFVPRMKDVSYDNGQFTFKNGKSAEEFIKVTLANRDVRTVSISRSTLARAAMTLDAMEGKAAPETIKEPVLYSSREQDRLQESLDQKFERQRRFTQDEPALRERIDSDAAKGNEEAAVLRLISRTGFRVGGKTDLVEGKEVFGASTLTPKHIQIKGDVVSFDFMGKSGVRQRHSIKDAAIAKDLKGRLANAQLFGTSDRNVRRYLDRIVDGKDYIIHDYRTWHATEAARKIVADLPQPQNEAEFIWARNLAGSFAASKIGDDRKTTLKHYVDPQIFQAWRDGINQTGVQTSGRDGAGQSQTARDRRAGAGRDGALDERASAEQVALSSREDQSNFEIAPDPNNKELTGEWRTLPGKVKTQFSRAISEQITPQILKLHHAIGKVVEQVGSYLDDTNPSFALKLAYGKLDEVSKSIGFVYRQAEMTNLSTKPFPGSQPGEAVVLEIGNKTPEQIAEIYTTIRSAVSDVAGQSSSDGVMLIINNKEGVDTTELHQKIDAALGGVYTTWTEPVHFSFPESKDYNYDDGQINTGTPSEIREDVRQGLNRLRDQASTLLAEQLAQYRAQAANQDQAHLSKRGEHPQAPLRGTLSNLIHQALSSVSEAVDKAGSKSGVYDLVAPMSAGTQQTRALAQDWINQTRKADYQWRKIDEAITSKFTKAQREKMWNAADEENDMRRAGIKSEGSGKGLDSLTPKEREVMDDLHTYSQELWQRAQDVGMVSGEGVDYWTPRMMVVIGESGEYSKPGEGKQGTSAGVGRNFSTSAGSTKQRKYELSSETEAAMVAKGGALVRDIRTMPLAMAKLEKAIAGRELINEIKDVGKVTGKTTVNNVGGEGFFTLDHPAFKTYGQRFDENGMVNKEDGTPVIDAEPLYISNDFKGPLKAILSQGLSNNPIYTGYMLLKSKAMSAIMYSPLIHNQVILGRALAYGGVKTPVLYFTGNKAKGDTDFMQKMIGAGMVPIGNRNTMLDVGDIASGVGRQGSWGDPNESWLGLAAQKLGNKAKDGLGDAIKGSIDTLGDLWHNKLLWDRVGDLQAGIAQDAYSKLKAKGLDENAATTVAAHIANRYAGAIGKENLSELAHIAANITLFSKSFNMGNVGTVKDAFYGLPAGLRAQLAENSDAQSAAKALDFAKHKARIGLVRDLAFAILITSLVQDWFKRDKDKDWGEQLSEGLEGYQKRAAEWWADEKENPLHILNPHNLYRFSSTWNNEPGKQDRVDLGEQASGRHEFMRLPAGKVIEDLIGWMFHPIETAGKKKSPLMSAAQRLNNEKDPWGTPVWDEDGAIHEKVWDLAKALVGTHMPLDQLGTLKDMAQGYGSDLDKAKMAGNITGLSISQGNPRGPEGAVAQQALDRFEQSKRYAMEIIKHDLKVGKEDRAVALMEKIGMTPREVTQMINRIENPKGQLSKQQFKNFNKHANEAEQKLMDRARD